MDIKTKIHIIKNEIVKCAMFEYQEIYKIIKSSNSNYSKNINGIFVDLQRLDISVIDQIYTYIMYCNKLTKNIDAYEDIKNNIIKTNFQSLDDVDDIKRTLDIVGNFKKVKSKHPIVAKAFEDFIKLTEIPESSPFKILSYFSILELILTTNNEKTSITHQLATKVMLINKRLQEEICISKFFKVNPNIDTLIKRLYELRSQIAHGSFSSFETFKIETKYPFKQAIPDFIYEELLTKIIIQSLIEPELIEDLRKC